MQVLHFLFADYPQDSLGRVSIAHLDDQTLLELLMGSRKMSPATRRLVKSVDGDFEDIHDWGINRFDSNGMLYEIEWGFSGMVGTFEMRYVPRTVKSISVASNRMRGHIDWGALPEELQKVQLHWNQFSGSADFSNLPQTLQVINIHTNRFSGSVDLSNMPKVLTLLNITSNRLNGVLDLDALPQGTKVGYDKNSFEKVIGQREGPARMQGSV